MPQFALPTALPPFVLISRFAALSGYSGRTEKQGQCPIATAPEPSSSTATMRGIKRCTQPSATR